MQCAVTQSYLLQQIACPLAESAAMPGVRPHVVPYQAGKQDILQGRKFRKQVIKLKDHPHLAAAEPIPLGMGKVVDAPAVQVNLSVVGPIEGPQKVQQGALSTAALADHCQHLSGRNPQINSLQHRDLDISLSEVLL
jgi:hypothetical protein